MTSTTIPNQSGSSTRVQIDWTWVGVGFCLFVVFHLLPLSVMFGFLHMWKGTKVLIGLWTFFGIALIGLLIGYRSRGVTILEPGISVFFYFIVVVLAFRNQAIGPWNWTALFGLITWSLVACFVAMASAWVGEMIQRKKEARAT